MNTQVLFVDDILEDADSNNQDRLRELLQDERYARIFDNFEKNAKTATWSMKFHVNENGGRENGKAKRM